MFCEYLLEKYRHDQRIMRISGFNPLVSSYPSKFDYFFSNFSFGWGWATWRRAWLLNDPEMTSYNTIHERGWDKGYPFTKDRIACFQEAFDGLNTWDYQWDFLFCVNMGWV